MIRTMVVDDDAPMRLALVDLLARDPALTVVAEAVDGLQAVELAGSMPIDVVLMDIRMPRLDGIAATRRLRELPDAPRVIALTTADLDECAYRALAAGADGFLLKDAPPAEIARAVQIVAGGRSMLHPVAARRLIDRYHRTGAPRSVAARSRVAGLTPRETDVLRELTDGLSNAEIAGVLGMRECTVKAHVSRILIALGVGSRVQAALLARDAGLVQDGV
ncbi:response regulator transcription factor [Streptomyces kaniharaensis]|uniref:Response regulator transcription factor n=1 Tax=Streptomyces kaniharaensis TaxID=212423 RepID=A0A6N7KTT6_9ACTN|nr:response regulator transcription factor [Streptomyces kaniharaensis]MQS15052.1 response regulator transcription factor [Streptomyces kaniharaensis]